MRYLLKWSQLSYLKADASKVHKKVLAVLVLYLLSGIHILVCLSTECSTKFICVSKIIAHHFPGWVENLKLRPCIYINSCSLLLAKNMFFRKQKFDVKQLKLTKIILDVKELKINRFIKSVLKLVVSSMVHLRYLAMPLNEVDSLFLSVTKGLPLINQSKHRPVEKLWIMQHLVLTRFRWPLLT